MSERIIDRFDKYLSIKGLSDNKITVQLGFSIGMLGKSRKKGRDLSKRAIEKILNFYTDIEKVWLLTGEGEMLKEINNDDERYRFQIAEEDSSPGSYIKPCKECLKKDQRIKELEELLKEKDVIINNLNEIIRQQITEWGAAASAWRVPDDKKDTG